MSFGVGPIPTATPIPAPLLTYMPELPTRTDFMAQEDEDLSEDSMDYSVTLSRAIGSRLGESRSLRDDGFSVTEEGLHFKTNGRRSAMSEVWVNGQRLSRTHYTVQNHNGQAMVVLKPEYLETLEKGLHTLRVLFTDGSAEKALPSGNETVRMTVTQKQRKKETFPRGRVSFSHICKT